MTKTRHFFGALIAALLVTSVGIVWYLYENQSESELELKPAPSTDLVLGASAHTQPLIPAAPFADPPNTVAPGPVVPTDPALPPFALPPNVIAPSPVVPPPNAKFPPTSEGRR